MDERSQAQQSGTRVLGILGLLTGGTFLIHLAIVAQLPNTTDLNALSAYRTHSTVYTALWISAGLFGGVSIPFVAGIANWLRGKSPELSAASAAAMATGIVIIVLAVVLSVGILQAIDSTTGSPSTTAFGPTEAAFWTNEMGTINAFGQLLFGVGFLLLGWQALGRSGLPRWLAALAILGGSLGILGVEVDPLTLAFFATFVVWAIYFGARFVRTPSAGPDLG